MTTTSATGSISSAGIGSGLDVTSIITQLMAIESRPLTQMKTAATGIQTQISEVGKITSAMSAFHDAAAKLGSIDFWKQTTGSSSSSAVGITTTSTATAADFTVQVTSLASAQSIASATFASSSTALGAAGTLHLEMGTWGAGQTTFTASPTATPIDITVTATDTLASIRDRINAAGGGATASILTDASGARLVMQSTATGAANAFRTSVTGTGLAGLAFDPSTGSNGATQAQAAADASLTINGLVVKSPSNTLNNVLDGVSLTLNSPTTTAVTVSVKSDTAAIKTALQTFATAYSALAKQITTDTKYDATSKKGASLQGDSTIVGVQSRLRAMLGATNGATTSFQRLSDAGFEMQQDGSLLVNATKLDNAITNLAQMKTLFSNPSASDPNLLGYGKRFSDFTSSLTNSDGTITSRRNGLNDKLKRNQDAQAAMQTRLDQTQARLQKQYTALDAQLGTLNSLASYMTQQVAQWNKPAI